LDNLSFINEKNNFTSDFELRIYTSGCYYLDQYNNWQSDGLLVSFISFLLFKLNLQFRLDQKQILIKLNVFQII
jgi:hypothetical protein